MNKQTKVIKRNNSPTKNTITSTNFYKQLYVVKLSDWKKIERSKISVTDIG